MNILRLFLLASSFFVMIFPLLYIGRPYLSKGAIKELPFENIAVILPLYYGISFVILNLLLQNVKNKRMRYAISGAIIGFVLSLVGHFVYRVPEKIFDISPNLVHLIAPVMYAFIFGVIVYFVDENI